MKPRQSILTLIVSLLTWFFAMQTGWSFYNPSTGRWLNRDPIEEQGGRNIYECAQNNLINNTDILGLTAHLAPLNDIIDNQSSYDVYISGDWVEIGLYTPGRETVTIRPWSYWEFFSIMNNLPSGTKMSYNAPSGPHTLGPGHNSAADWVAGLTRIVDADFLTGASVPVYTDSGCKAKMNDKAKVGFTLLLTVRDCPMKCKVKGVYYSGGSEYPPAPADEPDIPRDRW